MQFSNEEQKIYQIDTVNDLPAKICAGELNFAHLGMNAAFFVDGGVRVLKIVSIEHDRLLTTVNEDAVHVPHRVEVVISRKTIMVSPEGIRIGNQ